MNRLFLIALLALTPTPAPRSDISFPRDHGSHPDAPIEWWYYTGHLRDEAGREFGFQLTFFRVQEVHLAHFAWTDVAARAFHFEEKSHLALPGIAEAAEGRLDVSNEDWSARASDGFHRLRAGGHDGQLELTLRAAKAPVLNGPGGISRKGAGANDYSHYVSITSLEASGEFRDGRRRARVSGSAWFDHEWGPGGLPREVVGWDWFALQLSDGSELMLYRMRAENGAATDFSAGTFVPKTGPARPVSWREVSLTEISRWRSARTKASYPAGWRIAVSSLGLDLSVEPLVADQELVTEQSTAVTYWEGACRVSGSRAGKPIEGRAYAELTGYAGQGGLGALRSKDSRQQH
jgi:predicted secreted hydrolase